MARKVLKAEPPQKPPEPTTPIPTPPETVMKAAIHAVPGVQFKDLIDLDDVAGIIRDEGRGSWVDIATPDPPGILARMGVELPAGNGVECTITDQVAESRTLIAIPCLRRDGDAATTLYALCIGTHALVTVHSSGGPKEPLGVLMERVEDYLDEETDGGKLPVTNFRDFVFAYLMVSVAEEFVACMEEASRRLHRIYETLTGKGAPLAIQASLYREHRFLSETLGGALFAYREFVVEVKKGSGRFLRAGTRAREMEEVGAELALALEMKQDLNNTVELISNAVRAKLSDRNIEQTTRLNFAVELLTRVSVLLMIPNSVFTFWPTMGIPPDALFWGVPSWVWELIVSGLLFAASQVVISWYYSHSLLGEVVDRIRKKRVP